MKLTDGERLIVVMLAEVMEAVKTKGDIDPALVKSFAISRDDWAIASRYPSLGADDTMPADVQETHEMLTMWRVIEHSIAQLTGADAAEVATFAYTKFEGFDGNNDAHHHITRTLINDLGLYDEFASRDLNSHSTMSLPTYRSMLPKYDAAMKGFHSLPLPIEALRDILN